MVDDERRPGIGPLTYGRVLRQALGMFREHYGRVAIVALTLFIAPTLILGILDGWRESLATDPGLIGSLGFVVGLAVAAGLRLFGPVVYAGYLDEAVGREYFHAETISFGGVLRSLPWLRLLTADVVVVVATLVGLGLFVLPGLAFLTLFGLVGPVIVQERHGIVDAFRRTYQISRPAWRMVFVLVVSLLGVEIIIEELMHQAIHDSGVTLKLVVEWLAASLVGGIVGLIEVALATELMARNPRRFA